MRSDPRLPYGDARDVLRATKTTPRGNLAWVARFIAYPARHWFQVMKNCTPDIIRLCEELYTVIHLPIWQDKGLTPPLYLEALKQVDLHRHDVVHDGRFEAGVETWVALLFRCHPIAFAALDSLVKDGVAVLPRLNLTPIVYRDGRQPRKEEEHGAHDLADLVGAPLDEQRAAYVRLHESLFTERLRDLLQAAGARLRACPCCGRVFVIARATQRSCSHGCRGRGGMRTMRRRDRDDLAA